MFEPVFPILYIVVNSVQITSLQIRTTKQDGYCSFRNEYHDCRNGCDGHWHVASLGSSYWALHINPNCDLSYDYNGNPLNNPYQLEHDVSTAIKIEKLKEFSSS
jgi:hypothetical protein